MQLKEAELIVGRQITKTVILDGLNDEMLFLEFADGDHIFFQAYGGYAGEATMHVFLNEPDPYIKLACGLITQAEYDNWTAAREAERKAETEARERKKLAQLVKKYGVSEDEAREMLAREAPPVGVQCRCAIVPVGYGDTDGDKG